MQTIRQNLYTHYRSAKWCDIVSKADVVEQNVCTENAWMSGGNAIENARFGQSITEHHIVDNDHIIGVCYSGHYNAS